MTAAHWGWVAVTGALAALAWAGHAIGRALNSDPFDVFPEDQ